MEKKNQSIRYAIILLPLLLLLLAAISTSTTSPALAQEGATATWTLTPVPGCYYPGVGTATLDPNRIDPTWAAGCVDCLEPATSTPGATPTATITPTATSTPQTGCQLSCAANYADVCPADGVTLDLTGYGLVNALPEAQIDTIGCTGVITVYASTRWSVDWVGPQLGAVANQSQYTGLGMDPLTVQSMPCEGPGSAGMCADTRIDLIFHLDTGVPGAGIEHTLGLNEFNPVGADWVYDVQTVFSLLPNQESYSPTPTPMPGSCASPPSPGSAPNQCDLAFDVNLLVDDREIDATDEVGEMSTFTEGQWYMMETYGGPWDPGLLGGDSYSIAVSEDGEEWREFPHWWWASCEGHAPSPYERVYFQAMGDRLFFRVNDEYLFSDNTGTMSYKIWTVSGDSCSSNFDLSSVLIEETIDADTNNNDINLVDGNWYAIETFGGPWLPSLAGLPRYDLAVAQDDGDGDPSQWSALTLGSPAWMSCKVQLGEGYYRGYWRQYGDAIHARVNDDGVFADNLDTLGIKVYGVNRYYTGPGNVLLDGNMEATDNIPWQLYSDDPSEQFVRVFDSATNRLIHGTPACGLGFQVVQGHGSGQIAQAFDWAGGRLYFQVQAKANPIQWWYGGSYASVRVSQPGLNNWVYLVENAPINRNWSTLSGNVVLQPGVYLLVIEAGSLAGSTDTIYFDDMAVDYVVPSSACDTGGIEITPTPTSSPTLTPTTNPSYTPTLTPTSTPGQYGGNCNFEGSGWLLNTQSSIVHTGGVVGDSFGFASGSKPNIWYPFTWPGGTLYLDGYVRNQAEVRLYNPLTYSYYQLYSDYTGDWMHIQRTSLSLPAGTYRLELNSRYITDHGDFDGITISNGGFSTCSYSTPTPTVPPLGTATLYPTDTQTAPEKTATAQGTIIPTYTPRPPTVTPVPTYTPYPTYTPQPSPTPAATKSPTPYPTWTPQATSTPLDTPAPTDTQTAPEKTATAQGTNVPTYTPRPTGTPGPPPQQPPSACDNDCKRPRSYLEISHWIDYEKCEGFKYVAWCPEHSATIVAIPTMFNDHEPFGMVGEMSDAKDAVTTIIAQYDWENTGLEGQRDAPDDEMFTGDLPADSPWNGGDVDLTDDSVVYSTVCEWQLEAVLGSRLSVAVCFIFNILYQLALMPYLQLFINLSCFLALFMYVGKRWIDKGAT